MLRTGCLSCEVVLTIAMPPEIGQKICCPECNATLEVVWLFPLTLDFAIELLADESSRENSLVSP
jgi:hypothetical protein